MYASSGASSRIPFASEYTFDGWIDSVPNPNRGAEYAGSFAYVAPDDYSTAKYVEPVLSQVDKMNAEQHIQTIEELTKIEKSLTKKIEDLIYNRMPLARSKLYGVAPASLATSTLSILTSKLPRTRQRVTGKNKPKKHKKGNNARIPRQTLADTHLSTDEPEIDSATIPIPISDDEIDFAPEGLADKEVSDSDEDSDTESVQAQKLDIALNKAKNMNRRLMDLTTDNTTDARRGASGATLNVSPEQLIADMKDTIMRARRLIERLEQEQ